MIIVSWSIGRERGGRETGPARRGTHSTGSGRIVPGMHPLSNQTRWRDTAGGGVMLITPAIANRHVGHGTQSEVAIYGLPS